MAGTLVSPLVIKPRLPGISPTGLPACASLFRITYCQCLHTSSAMSPCSGHSPMLPLLLFRLLSLYTFICSQASNTNSTDLSSKSLPLFCILEVSVSNRTHLKPALINFPCHKSNNNNPQTLEYHHSTLEILKTQPDVILALRRLGGRSPWDPDPDPG